MTDTDVVSHDRWLVPKVGKATKENLTGLPPEIVIEFALCAQALATVDGLTGLFTRRFFEDEVPKRLARRESSGALLVIDIDCFKEVNDEYGHQIGDLILLEIANQMKSIIRPIDLAGRFGGDEFVVFFSGVSSRIAWTRATDLLRGVELATSESKKTPSVTVSIGIAVVNADENLCYTDLFKKADSELFIAKEYGRNRISPAFSVVSSHKSERRRKKDRRS